MVGAFWEAADHKQLLALVMEILYGRECFRDLGFCPRGVLPQMQLDRALPACGFCISLFCALSQGFPYWALG